MEFNITLLDKTLLLQTLFVHAADTLAEADAEVNSGLSDAECKRILKGRYYDDNGCLLDDYEGRTMKIYWTKTPDGRMFADALPYDSVHGRFRFLEALLNVFDPSEIIITSKDYHAVNPATVNPMSAEKHDQMLHLIESAIMYADVKGTYWKIDEGMNYRSSFLAGLDI
ncbi:hypothetical protein [Foetidibacter luteolus]|uniref:hypothetical protein n=1 Tax=Foetidibacter luteolus TaxID=2608880 RepID=UPI00129BAA89|nr:hypothetical protein [Foetidibacter luteolus]